jgi:hypothetical protein
MPNDKALQIRRQFILHSDKPCFKPLVLLTNWEAGLVSDVIHRSAEAVKKHGVGPARARQAQ